MAGDSFLDKFMAELGFEINSSIAVVRKEMPYRKAAVERGNVTVCLGDCKHVSTFVV